jgi:CubicO group peptidase (beta-lactamase class C family)
MKRDMRIMVRLGYAKAMNKSAAGTTVSAPARSRDTAAPRFSTRQLRNAAWKLFVPVLVSFIATAQADADHRIRDVFPEKHWEHVHAPEQMGWSSEKLSIAKQYADSVKSSAVLIVDHGIVVAEWGVPGRKYSVNSVRKSLISALVGIAVARGEVKLDSTLEELGIDDNPPSLTAEEKRARVIDLLKARSGIYHAALYETPGMTALKPARGSHPPNTFWHYNNWDFNTLGSILEHATGKSVFQSFADELAGPLHMEDFELSDTEYVRGEQSIHPAYPFRLSARDLARFGLLYLRNGSWKGRQVVSRGWVEESTKAYSVADGMPDFGYSGYGYLWWVEINGNLIPGIALPDGSFSAEGYRGQYLTVIPKLDLVIVNQFDSDPDVGGIYGWQYGKLLSLILDSRTEQLSKAPSGHAAAPAP